MRRLLVFAKYPRPGSVKTRLVPLLTHVQAAELYAAMLCDSVGVWSRLPGIDLALYIADPDDADPIRRILCQGGRQKWEGEREEGEGLREGDGGVDDPIFEAIPIFPQRGDDLGERLLNAFAESFDAGYRHVAVIGTDHPTLPDRFVSLMFDELERNDLVLGPADDGGYYTIGLAFPSPELFRNMPWSTSDLLRRTIGVAGQIGLRFYLLPEWYDVDDERTLRRLMHDTANGEAGPMVSSFFASAGDLLSEGGKV